MLSVVVNKLLHWNFKFESLTVSLEYMGFQLNLSQIIDSQKASRCWAR